LRNSTARPSKHTSSGVWSVYNDELNATTCHKNLEGIPAQVSNVAMTWKQVPLDHSKFNFNKKTNNALTQICSSDNKPLCYTG